MIKIFRNHFFDTTSFVWGRGILWFLSFFAVLVPSDASETGTDVGEKLSEQKIISSESLFSDSARAKKLPFGSHVSLELSGNVSYLLPKDEACRAIMHNYCTSFYGVRFNYNTMPSDGDRYDAALNYPTLQAGFLLGDYSHISLYRDKPRLPYNSRVGHVYTLYGGLTLYVLHHRRWRLGFDLDNGIAFVTHPYNKRNNADNELFGSTYAIYVNMGFLAKYQISPQWALGAGIDFKHYSNGTLDRPNKGSNTLGLTLSLDYSLQPMEDYKKSSGNYHSHNRFEPFKKYVYLDLSAGVGVKTLLDDWNNNYFCRHPADPKYRSEHYPVYSSFVCMLAPMYRYSLTQATGIGLDYTYAKYASRLRNIDHEKGIDKYRYSRHVLGISLRHEIFYHHFSLAVGAGWYAFRRMGYIADTDEGHFFQTAGLRYSFPFTHDALFMGYNVKAHRFSKADCMQFTVGWRFKCVKEKIQ